MVLAAGVFEISGVPGVPGLAGGGNGATEMCVRTHGAPLKAGQTDRQATSGFRVDNEREGRKQQGEMWRDLRKLHEQLEGGKEARLGWLLVLGALP